MEEERFEGRAQVQSSDDGLLAMPAQLDGDAAIGLQNVVLDSVIFSQKRVQSTVQQKAVVDETSKAVTQVSPLVVDVPSSTLEDNPKEIKAEEASV